jgi:hypothetical protein
VIALSIGTNIGFTMNIWSEGGDTPGNARQACTGLGSATCRDKSQDLKKVGISNVVLEALCGSHPEPKNT